MSLKTLSCIRLIPRLRITNYAPIAVRTFRWSSESKDQRWQWKRHTTAAAFLGSILVGAAVSDKIKKEEKVEPPCEQATIEAGALRSDLPTFRAEEVSKHDNKSNFWVTYKHGVYDVTKFLTSHPGGEQILNAAGYSIEPFWNVYGMHKTEEVYKLLETFRIGNLHEDDIVDHSGDELWAREPTRDARLCVKTNKPFNAETPPQHQVDHFDTPSEMFYVRQHMPVPELDGEAHVVRVLVRGPAGDCSRQYSVRELHEKFPYVEVRAALMCAGNRRSEMNKVKQVKGISWTTGAIGNARWGGVALVHVLADCGVDLADTDGKHVIFTGADIDATGVNFSTSIPLSMAADPRASVLLATSMNGGPLAPDHGRPLRALVPGAPAVRSVKWLESITISEDESPSHWHRKDYRSFNPSVSWETADFDSAPPLYSLPVTSAICVPSDGDEVKVVDGCIEVKGYAYSGGGAKVLRVDLSVDGGRSWQQAAFSAQDAAPPRAHYAWALWTASVPVPASLTEVELWAKATDSNFNTQPERFDDIWNIRGILSNAYHRVKVKLKH